MAKVVREIERKYDLTGGGAPPLDGLPGVASVAPLAEEVLDAVYYDTKDLRLIRSGITLRQRTGGADAGWHLKLPAGPDARDEIRLPLTEQGGPVPGELAALVRAHTRGAALAPVVRICTVRSLTQLRDTVGRPLAEIAADTVSAEPTDGSGRSSWQELEVELIEGHRKLLTAVDGRLRAAGARPAAAGTKLARALGERLASQAGPARPDGPGTPRGSSAGDVVLAYLETQIHAVTHYDPLVRRNEPDAVHQMRVASRRARSALQAFGSIVDRESTRHLCDELKWLAGVLGRARDAEVLQARLDDLVASTPAELLAGPVSERIAEYFRSELEKAHAAVVAALNGRRYLKLLGALDALAEHPPLTPLAAEPADEALRGPVRRAARRLERALELIPGDNADAAIHEARKAAKRARYAAEAALPALGRRAERQAARTKALQTLLGDHQDSVVARALLRRLSGEAHQAGEDTFPYGVLYEREACGARQIQRSLTGKRKEKIAGG